MKNNIELLSPAGSFESMEAAVECGCDAVYLGGKNFNARNAANNFDDDQVIGAIDYCHLRNVKTYITLNTLYKNSELDEVLAFVKKMYEAGADAFIVQDIGMASFIKKHFGDIRLFASTQMTAHSLEDVEFLGSIGIDRVILSRELSLKEIKHISKNTKVETEVFVHGALCVSYSGQCMMSSMLGGRSGNRGKCAQTCRMVYDLMNEDQVIEKGYLLSPKDMMTLDILSEILDSGVSSLKIEGRMKSPEYVSIATKSYREQIDKIYGGITEADEAAKKDLKQTFNRGGDFSTGYFKNYAGTDMMSIKTPKSTGILVGEVIGYDERNHKCSIITCESFVGGDGIEIWTGDRVEDLHVGTNINKVSQAGETITVIIEGDIKKGDLVYKSFDKKLNDRLKKLHEKDTKKTQITGSIKAVLNEEMVLTLKNERVSVEVKGVVVEKAQNQGLTREKLIAQLSKTGNTPFFITYEDNMISENIFMGISAINELRRKGIELFSEKLIESYKRKSNPGKPEPVIKKSLRTEPQKLTALVNSSERFEAVLNPYIERIYFEVNFDFLNNHKYYTQACEENNIKLYGALPRISRDGKALENMLDVLEKSNIDGYLFRTLGQYEYFKHTEKMKAIDFNFNVTNSLSNEYFFESSQNVTLSPELNLTEIQEFATGKNELIIYGRLPLMTTAQCPVGLYAGKKKEGKFCLLKNKKSEYYLKDRKNVDFPVITDCEICVATILNSRAIFMLDKMHDIKRCSAGLLRLEFKNETIDDIKKCIYSYGRLLNDELEDHAIRTYMEKNKDKGVTHGHFYRGVI